LGILAVARPPEAREDLARASFQPSDIFDIGPIDQTGQEGLAALTAPLEEQFKDEGPPQMTLIWQGLPVARFACESAPDMGRPGPPPGFACLCAQRIGLPVPNHLLDRLAVPQVFIEDPSRK